MSEKPKLVHFHGGVRTVWIGRRVGPAWTTHGGELDQPTITCHGCRHLLFNDSHYPYCSAQWAENQKTKAKISRDGRFTSYAYPWMGAGVHIFDTKACGCPYPTPWTDVRYEA